MRRNKDSRAEAGTPRRGPGSLESQSRSGVWPNCRAAILPGLNSATPTRQGPARGRTESHGLFAGPFKHSGLGRDGLGCLPSRSAIGVSRTGLRYLLPRRALQGSSRNPGFRPSPDNSKDTLAALREVAVFKRGAGFRREASRSLSQLPRCVCCSP